MEDCPFCDLGSQEKYIVYQTAHAYSLIPLAPLLEGHVMVLPKRHTTMEDLTSDELREINDMLFRLKEHLKRLYPSNPPLIATTTDTRHSSRPGHFHYHLIPSEVNLRVLWSTYYEEVPENKRLDDSELGRMAKKLRPGGL